MRLILNGSKEECIVSLEEIQSVSFKDPCYDDYNQGYININLKNGNSIKLQYDNDYDSCYAKNKLILKEHLC